MKRLVAFSCLVTLAGPALAGDPMAIARDRAKETSQAVSAGQPAPSHAQPAQPNAVSTPPSPALLALQQNVASLASDLAALQSDASKKQPLLNDLNAAAQGTSPSKTSVDKLVTDLSSALAGKKLPTESCAKLAQYLRAFFNSSHVAPAQQRTILEDLAKILSAGGVAAEDSTRIVADFKTIAAEVK